MISASIEICRRLCCRGHVVLQAFLKDGGVPSFIEANLRFGGASNLSIVAGLDSPRRFVQCVYGNAAAAAEPREIRNGLYILRYSTDIFLTAAGEVVG